MSKNKTNDEIESARIEAATKEHVRRLTELKKAVDNWISFSEANADNIKDEDFSRNNLKLRKQIEFRGVEVFYGEDFWPWYQDLMKNMKAVK